MKIKLLFSLLLVGNMIFAHNDDVKRRFEQDLKSKNENVSTIECGFVYTRDVAVLAGEVRKQGNFRFSQPGNILIAFDDGDYIRITEEWFEMKTAGNVSSTKVASNPMLKNLKSILAACVGGNFEQMAKGFEVDICESGSEWSATLSPQRGKAASKISRIVISFDKKDMSLNTLKMIEKSGDSTTYTFFDKKFNADVDK